MIQAFVKEPSTLILTPRPSCLDLITLLRKEIATNRPLVEALGFHTDWKSLGLAAAA